MKIEIGRNVKGGGEYLASKEFESHLHVVGLTRSGKSMWLLELVLKLLRLGKAVGVIDPHWKLVNFILSYLVCHSINRPVTLFSPSYEKYTVGFNPFQTPYTDEGRKMTKAERLSQQLMHVFGMENTDQYGNIEKYLRAIFYTILDRNLSIADLDCFLYWSLEDKRRPIIEAVSSVEVKAELKDLYSSKTEFDRKISSTKNKLQRFSHRQMKRIMGLKENNINLDALIENKGILLCNLQPSETDLVGRENMRALGTLLISELWESFRKRTKPQEFYLVVDEMTEYMTPDLIEILPRSAGYGLHCILVHQDQGQLSPALASAIKNAQTKIYFSTEDSPKQQRYFTLRKADHSTADVIAPLVNLHKIPQERIDRYVEQTTRHFLTPEEVDARLKTSHNEDTPTPEDLDPNE